MKSAIELAMERAKKISGEIAPSLSEDLKKQIADIRNRYRAKMAEAEILLKEEGPRVKEIGRLQEECEAKVQEIYRNASKSKS